jgi:hypothetical protein
MTARAAIERRAARTALQGRAARTAIGSAGPNGAGTIIRRAGCQRNTQHQYEPAQTRDAPSD